MKSPKSHTPSKSQKLRTPVKKGRSAKVTTRSKKLKSSTKQAVSSKTKKMAKQAGQATKPVSRTRATRTQKTLWSALQAEGINLRHRTHTYYDIVAVRLKKGTLFR
jgi:hypothetical protein